MNIDDQRTPALRDLLRLHVEAVWSIPVPALDADEVTLAQGVSPRWLAYHARLMEGDIRVWRADAPDEERAALAGLTERALDHPDEAIAGVTREVALRLAAEPRMSLAEAERLARRLRNDDDPRMLAFYEQVGYHLGGAQEPIIGVVAEGRLLAVAHSSRRTAQACELGINTLPEARRRGYALAATILWTRAILHEGLIPVYSALAENSASLALAAATGYREFARAAYVKR
jgi:RimJ/RimL family protein N-acetyltransferase